jgi:hypothetical protein
MVQKEITVSIIHALSAIEKMFHEAFSFYDAAAVGSKSAAGVSISSSL